MRLIAKATTICYGTRLKPNSLPWSCEVYYPVYF